MAKLVFHTLLPSQIIHQIYWDFSGQNKPMPSQWKKNQATWKKHHPHWDYKLWNKEDCLQLISLHYPWFLKIFIDYPHEIQRCDAIRPFILYHYGGVYVDCDQICLKCFDDVFQQPGVYLTKQNTPLDKNIVNCMMASSPKQVFWTIVFDQLKNNYKQKWYQYYSLYIVNSTGPGLISRAAALSKNNEIHYLDQKKFNPFGYCTKNYEVDDTIYTFSKYDASWGKWDTTLIVFLNCKCKIIFTTSFIILVLVLIFMSF